MDANDDDDDDDADFVFVVQPLFVPSWCKVEVDPRMRWWMYPDDATTGRAITFELSISSTNKAKAAIAVFLDFVYSCCNDDDMTMTT